MGGDATGVWKICSAMRRELTGLPERRDPAAILAEKPANANRRERLLPAVGVNQRGGLARCGSKGSPNDTLLEHVRENTRAELTDESNRNVMSA